MGSPSEGASPWEKVDQESVPQGTSEGQQADPLQALMGGI